MQQTARQLYEFGPFRLDPDERTLVRAGQPVPLKPMVFDLLLHFVARPVSWLKLTTPNGHADTQYRQPLQMSWLMLTVPNSLR